MTTHPSDRPESPPEPTPLWSAGDPAPSPPELRDDALPVRLLADLHLLANAPAPIPAPVDAAIAAAIAGDTTTSRGRPHPIRLPAPRPMRLLPPAWWSVAATVALACGAWLGWRSAPQVRTAPLARHESAPGPSRTPTNRPTIVDAMLAARFAAGPDARPHGLDALLLARLDADGDGQVTARDAALLATRAVAWHSETSS